MKVQVVRPNIEKFRIRMERADADYHRCMWADILIDHDAYAITAQTDCGNYAHRWPVSDNESFRDLCLRMLDDEDYLLRKFSERTKFDLAESKLLFRDFNRHDPEAQHLIESVNAVKANTEADWVAALEEIGGIPEPWEYIVREYPTGAKTFVSLLGNIVLPEMRKERTTA